MHRVRQFQQQIPQARFLAENLNAKAADIAALLKRRHVAVVGISADESKPSYHVAQCIQERGKKIIPVRPGKGLILGEQVVNSLKMISLDDAPRNDLVVNVFRKPDEVESVVDDAIAAGVTGIWFQLGVVNEKAIEKARRHGMVVVADKCLWIELRDQQ